jgi:hypothetical protein
MYNSSPLDCTVNGTYVGPGRLAGPLEGFTVIEVGGYPVFWWTNSEDSFYVPSAIQVS